MTHPAFGPERINPAKTDGHPADEAANDFAAQLLMPESSFREKAKELGGNVFQLSQAFGVPKDAVRRRAAMLGMTGHGIDDTSRWEEQD